MFAGRVNILRARRSRWGGPRRPVTRGAFGAYQGRMNVSCSASFLVKAALWLVVVGAVLGVVLSQ